MKKLFLVSVSISILFLSCNKNKEAKPDHSGMFIKFFGGAKDDAGYSIKESGDGGFVIVGSIVLPGKTDKDCYIVKTDGDGNKLWDQSFGGDKDEEAIDIKVDVAGNYLVAGYQYDTQDSSDFLVLKYSKDGVLLNTFKYGLGDRNERARFITVTSDGGVLIAGSRQKAMNSQMNMFLVKTNLDTVTWEKDLGLSALYDTIGTVVELPNTDLLFCGTVSRGSETDLRISMMDTHSNLKWDFSIGEGDGKSQRGREIQAVSDGTFIVAGSEASGDGIAPLLVNINQFGTVLWQTSPGGPGRSVNSVYPISGGGFILAGEKSSDYLIMKTDATGNLSWEKNYGGDGADRANKVIQTGDNGFLVIGTVYVANNTLLGLIKTDSKGEVNK